MDREKILRLVRMLKASQASDLEVERDGLRVAITRQLAEERAEAPAAEEGEGRPRAVEAMVEGVLVNSHVVGFFRRGREPGAEPLAEPGQRVPAGKPLCAVEALSRWVLVDAPVDCEVVEFLLEDGERTEYGTPLARLRAVGDSD